MDINILAKIYNSIGLVSDIVGAFLVASEVVKTYKGLQFCPLMYDDIGEPPKKPLNIKIGKKESTNI